MQNGLKNAPNVFHIIIITLVSMHHVLCKPYIQLHKAIWKTVDKNRKITGFSYEISNSIFIFWGKRRANSSVEVE